MKLLIVNRSSVMISSLRPQNYLQTSHFELFFFPCVILKQLLCAQYFSLKCMFQANGMLFQGDTKQKPLNKTL